MTATKKAPATHTPGPWSFAPTSIGGNQVVKGPEGERVCLCDTASPHFNPRGKSHEAQDRVANARLIAAAPLLLETMKLVLDYFQAMPNEQFDPAIDLFKKVNQSIGRATIG